MKALFSLFFGLFIAIAFLAFLDLGARLLLDWPSTDPKALVKKGDLGAGRLGYIPPRNGKQEHHFVHENQTIYKVTAQIDEWHRRKTPKVEGEKKQFSLFFGGSQTYGMGLSDEQTIPALFEKENPEFRSYNYANSGYGTAHMYARIENGFMDDEIKEPSGIAVYYYFYFHKDRVRSSLDHARWAEGNMYPLYLLEDSALVYKGNHFTGQPLKWLFYWSLAHSSILKKFAVNIPDWRYRYDPVTCELILASREILMKRYNVKRFLVATSTASNADPMIEECFAKNDLEHFHVPIRRNEVFPHDWHLNPLGAKHFVEVLSEEM